MSEHVVRAAAPRLPWLTLTSAGAALALAAAAIAPLELAYVPSAPSLGRLLGCHFVHFSTQHLLWDVLTFATVSACVERRLPRQHALFLGSAVFVVPPAACALTPWVRAYAGLSGLVLGQLAMLLATRLRVAAVMRSPARTIGYVASLAILLVKQCYEYRVGNTSLVTMDYRGFATVPAAHLVSVLVGILVGALGAPVTTGPRCVTVNWASKRTYAGVTK